MLNKNGFIMRSILLTALALMVVSLASGQMLFEKTYGGSSNDRLHGLAIMPQGYVLAGETTSYGAGNRDMFINKVNNAGELEWSKVLGGSAFERVKAVHYKNGKIYVAGATQTFGPGSQNMLMVCLDVNGNILWQKMYGGGQRDGSFNFTPTHDGFVLVGWTWGAGYGSDDNYIVRIDSLGNRLWAKRYGNNMPERAYGVIQAMNSDFLVVGRTNSYGQGGEDVYLQRFDTTGTMVWSKTYGAAGNGNERGFAIKELPNGDIILGGASNSSGMGANDALILKTDSLGNLIWSNTYGQAAGEIIYDFTLLADGSVIAAGQTGSYDNEAMLMKVDSSGTLLWAHGYGGVADTEDGYHVEQTATGGFVMGGTTASFGMGNEDFFLVKTDSTGQTYCENSAISLVTMPTAIMVGNGHNIQNYGNEQVPSVSVTSGGSVYCKCTYINAPNLDIVGPDTICAGTLNTFSIDTSLLGFMATYNWTMAQDWSITSGQATDSIKVVPGSAVMDTICIEITNNCGNVYTFCKPLYVYSSQLQLTTSGPVDFCIGDSVQLGVTGQLDPLNTTYDWSTGSTDSTITVYAAGTYSVDVIDNSFGCLVTLDTMVNVNPLPIIDAGSDVVVCEGDSVQVNATAGFVTYDWTPAATVSDVTIHDPWVTPPNDTTYYVTVTDANGCQNTDSLIASISQVNYIITTDNAICLGDSTDIVINGGSPAWQPSPTLSVSGNTATVWPAANTTYYVTITNNDGCSAIDSVSIDVSDIQHTLSADTLICLGDEAVLTATGGTMYQWSPNNNISSITDDVVTVTPTSTAYYYVEISNANGCSVLDSVLVSVSSVTASFLAVPLSGEAPLDVDFLNQSSGMGNLSYTWNFDENGAISSGIDASYLYEQEGTYNPWLIVENEWGCVDSFSVWIDVLPNTEFVLWSPNIFTPNGDGINDIYFPVHEGVEELHLMIFNRWGQLLFESSELDAHWDGTYQGTIVPDGVYVYVIDVLSEGGEYHEVTGHITVLQ